LTFSLLGRCAETGMVGCVSSSSSPAVGARCLHVRARVGAAASQNVTDPRLGPRLLDLLARGSAPAEAIAAIVEEEPNVEYRQLAAVDLEGRTAVYSGAKTLGRHATAEADGAVAAGNLLADTGVVEAMVEAFERSAGEHLGDRLLAALSAGLAAGGEEGPVRSAALLVADEVAWPVADLRVDWHDDPIGEVAALWRLWKPQLDEYVTRALEPASAPSFGVPGDR
jgi:uncharacterized Ntn-hydrolase superfamily protein